MCGIFCSINQCNNKSYKDPLNICKSYLNSRGPDKQNVIVFKPLTFYSSILWQQGSEPCLQPIDLNGIIFLFNGDIFMSAESFESDSDTKWLFNQICNCDNEIELLKLFKMVKGPYSIIFYNKKEKKLFFLRDSLGRNSLILTKVNDEIILSSVFPFKINEPNYGNPSSIEIPPLGLYCMHLNNYSLQLYPWIDIKSNDFYLDQISKIENTINSRIIIEDATIEPDWLIIEPQINYSFENVLNNYIGQPFNVIFEHLLENDSISGTVDKLIDLLRSSVMERVMKTPDSCKQCLLEQNEKCFHSRIGILFSGGLDCTILGVLADKLIDRNIPIDLLNVAFEKVRKANTAFSGISNFNVPDRLSGINTTKELQKLCPNRQWNLVEINISRSELKDQLSSRISDLIWPLNSVLDESLGAALWFAARGEGLCNGINYKSQSRVLLIGSGADEIFAGYTRHRNAYLREKNTNSNTTLEKELDMDWMRLPSRNLARDDRVIADHGITPRAPYLQEDFVKFIRSLSPLQKCYLNLEQGLGDKLLLRLSGYKLGLRDASVLKKKALQFGSRIADSKQNATDTSEFLK